MVGGGHHPHPLRVGHGLHPRRPDLPVPERLLLHGPELLAARVLAVLHVRPRPGRGGRGRRPVRELHRQADGVLDARGSELLSRCSSEGLKPTLDQDPGRSRSRTGAAPPPTLTSPLLTAQRSPSNHRCRRHTCRNSDFLLFFNYIKPKTDFANKPCICV